MTPYIILKRIEVWEPGGHGIRPSISIHLCRRDWAPVMLKPHTEHTLELGVVRKVKLRPYKYSVEFLCDDVTLHLLKFLIINVNPPVFIINSCSIYKLLFSVT